jgi:ketosteroid isomerase-like protein
MLHASLKRYALLTIVLSVSCVLDGRAQQASTAAEKEIRNLILQFTEVYGSNRLDTYFAFYAPELTWWGPNGRSDRESYRKFWTDNVQKTSGLDSADVSDLIVQVSPNADLASASYLLKVKQRGRPPDQTNLTYEMSAGLIKREGAWKIYHLHFQVVPPPAR